MFKEYMIKSNKNNTNFLLEELANTFSFEIKSHGFKTHAPQKYSKIFLNAIDNLRAFWSLHFTFLIKRGRSSPFIKY